MLFTILCSISHSQAKATVFDFTVKAPQYNQGNSCIEDGTPLNDLKELRVYVRYFDEANPILARVLLTSPYGGDIINFSLDLGSGVMGYIYVLAVDRNNNKSCMGATYTFAIPCQ